MKWQTGYLSYTKSTLVSLPSLGMKLMLVCGRTSSNVPLISLRRALSTASLFFALSCLNQTSICFSVSLVVNTNCLRSSFPGNGFGSFSLYHFLSLHTASIGSLSFVMIMPPAALFLLSRSCTSQITQTVHLLNQRKQPKHGLLLGTRTSLTLKLTSSQ